MRFKKFEKNEKEEIKNLIKIVNIANFNTAVVCCKKGVTYLFVDIVRDKHEG